jgi:hypothetical protein
MTAVFILFVIVWIVCNADFLSEDKNHEL